MSAFAPPTWANTMVVDLLKCHMYNVIANIAFAYIFIPTVIHYQYILLIA